MSVTWNLCHCGMVLERPCSISLTHGKIGACRGAMWQRSNPQPLEDELEPLFGSSEPRQLPEELEWHIDDRTQHVGKTQLLAGRPVGLNTHRVGRRTLPCLYEFPDLGWECPNCDRQVRFTCWVPLVCTDHPARKHVVMGAERTWQSVKTIKDRCLVEFHMVKVIRATPFFQKCTTQFGLSTLQRLLDVIACDSGDITRWLLHYWQWPELTRRFKQQYRESIRSRSIRERSELAFGGTFPSVSTRKVSE